ncbi:MAG: recombinase family protein [Chloroflexota bacterium]
MRESTDGQYDRYGPDSQRDQMDRFEQRYGLVSAGLEWTVAASGRSVWRHARMREMIAAAKSGAFDVLLTGYADRWQRNLRRFLELIEDDLHPSGVALVMCERRLLSSDPNDWDEMVREAHAAEIYSRRLGERIADGYAAKFSRYADPGGSAPMGFRRQADEPYLLEVDPERIGFVVELFEQYARGDVSFARLASSADLAEARVREILANPVYNGWAVRGSRGRRRPEERVPARWRDAPPVGDDLWERVCSVRHQHEHGGGPRRRDRIDPLAGVLYCTCGRYIKANGLDGSHRHQRIHLGLCDEWGRQRTYPTMTWARPLFAQLSALELSNATIERVVRYLSQPAPRGDDLRRKRLDRQRRELALDHAAGRIGDAEYLAAVGRTREQDEAVPVPVATPDPTHAVQRLRDFAGLWKSRSEAERAALLGAVYARVEVRGNRFIAAHLTADAKELGLTVALPETFAMARPAGIEPAT